MSAWVPGAYAAGLTICRPSGAEDAAEGRAGFLCGSPLKRAGMEGRRRGFTRATCPGLEVRPVNGPEEDADAGKEVRERVSVRVSPGLTPLGYENAALAGAGGTEA